MYLDFLAHAFGHTLHYILHTTYKQQEAYQVQQQERSLILPKPEDIKALSMILTYTNNERV